MIIKKYFILFCIHIIETKYSISTSTENSLIISQLKKTIKSFNEAFMSFIPFETDFETLDSPNNNKSFCCE